MTVRLTDDEARDTIRYLRGLHTRLLNGFPPHDGTADETMPGTMADRIEQRLRDDESLNDDAWLNADAAISDAESIAAAELLASIQSALTDAPDDARYDVQITIREQ